MRTFIILFLLLLSSCQWLNDRAIKAWTNDTIDTLFEMSLRKSMINDTPLKTMDALEAPRGVEIGKKDICKCATTLYGGILTVIANDVKASSVKFLCKDMGRCFFKSKPPAIFKTTCIDYVEAGSFKKMARDRRTNISRFTKARRQLSSHCSKL